MSNQGLNVDLSELYKSVVWIFFVNILLDIVLKGLTLLC